VLHGTNQKLSGATEPSEMAVLYCLNNNSEAVFAVAVFQLYKSLHDFLVRSHDEDSGDVKNFYENLKREWTDVFANYVHEAVVSVFYTVTGKYQILVGVLFQIFTVHFPFNAHHPKSFPHWQFFYTVLNKLHQF
jgi:hypothetical protein